MEPDGTQAGPEGTGGAGPAGPDPQASELLASELQAADLLAPARRILIDRFGFRVLSAAPSCGL